MQGLQQSHKEAINFILKGYLNHQHKVYLFGSRAKNAAKPFADIDLLIMGEKLSFEQLIQLKQAFSDSDVPFFIDIQQKTDIDENFYQAIEKDLVEWEMG